MMIENIFIDKTFEYIDYSIHGLPPGDYENCMFKDCIFANVSLNGSKFSDCVFKTCNLSSAKLDNTALREIHFKECKLLGLHFENCNQFLFSVTFDHCTLNLSSFFNQNIKKCSFRNCSLIEVDFTQADLTALVFDQCDFSLAIFDQTIIEKADFRTSFNYVINIEINRIKKAKFSKEGLIGLLQKYDICID